jgi:peptidoglycan hydrolase-like protein with peptidoglycan-binding domain
MSNLLKNGSRGDAVKDLQTKLSQLGYDVDADGIFGPGTKAVVEKLQTVFGYTVDGIVGEGTVGLIERQLGNGWNVNAPDAIERALRSQGKNDEADKMKAQREAAQKKK